MKLAMYIGCEYAPGQRTGFDFDVDLTENEIRELAREFLNNDDAYQDFEKIKRQYETLYHKIRSIGRDVLDGEMGKDTIKTDIKIAWGDNAEEFFADNFRDEKIHADFPLYHINEMKFCNLLQSTGREGVDRVLSGLRSIGFFKAPAAAKKHLAFEGGLVEHSLTVYHVLLRLVEDMRILRRDVVINEDSLKIVALLHDVCKATRYRWNTEKKEYESDYSLMPVGHGEKSVIMLLRMGLELRDDEIMAIRWHMGAWDLSLHSYEAQKNFVEAGSQSPLVPLLQTADTLAALIVEKGK